MEQIKCPLCGKQAVNITSNIDRDREIKSYKCVLCGQYSIARETLDDYLNDSKHDWYKPKISAFTKQRTIFNLEKPLIVSPHYQVNYPDRKCIIDFQSIANKFPVRISDRLDKALLNLARLSGFAGDKIKIDILDYPLIFSDNFEDNAFFFMLFELIKIGFIDGPKGVPGEFTITPKGWERIYELETKRNMKSRQGFVAMWFDPETDSIWENGFYKAIYNSGYLPYRIDKAEHNNDINDEMIAEIRKSKFVVCDFTGQRGGVYYEAGFALGIGLPVIMTCRKDWFDKCHFDTEHRNHIIWETEDELYNKLINRIVATII